MTRTYGSLALVETGSLWQIAELEPHVRIRLKQIFPRLPKQADPPYSFPNDHAHCMDLEWFVSRYPLAAANDDMARLAAGAGQFRSTQQELESILQQGYQPPRYAGLRDSQAVRTYQAQAVEILARAKGLLVGDDVGLGKTFLAAAGCLIPGALPAIIVCPVHIQRQWCRVIEEFTTLRAHAVIKAKPYDATAPRGGLPAADVYVFRYSQLGGWHDLIDQLGARLVAWDEIQELRKGTETAKGASSRKLAVSCEFRLGLSATPIFNYGIEIHAIMEFLRPGVLGTADEFYREWQDKKALGTYLREQYAFLRRTKRDVGKELAPVNKIIETIDYDVDTVKSIEDLAHQLAIAATTGSFAERGSAARELDLRVRHATGVSKAKHAADFIRILIESGEPVVVFAWHRDVYDILLEKLSDLRPAMYTGSETVGRKVKSAAAFVAGETDLLIMSLRSGAGVDGLQRRSSTVVFVELDWSPGVMTQCIGRLDREGQTSPVNAFVLVTNEGSDPPMMELLGLKSSISAQIIDPMLGPQAIHSDGSHLQMLVQRYLTGKRHAAAPSIDAVAVPAPAPAHPEQIQGSLFDRNAA